MIDIITFLFFIAAAGFLRDFPKIRRQYLSQWFLIPLLPLYNMLTYFFRFAGIINSINTVSSWKTMTITEEKDSIHKIFREDTRGIRKVIDKTAVVFDDTYREESKFDPIKSKSEGTKILSFLIIGMAIAGSLIAIIHVAVNGLSI